MSGLDLIAPLDPLLDPIVEHLPEPTAAAVEEINAANQVLLNAVDIGHLEGIKAAIKSGADLNSLSARTMNTPLYSLGAAGLVEVRPKSLASISLSLSHTHTHALTLVASRS